jgi:hypothetical protein
MIPMNDINQLPRDERDLADWLLAGAISGDYTPLSFAPEPSIPSQMQRCFAQLPPDTQQRFKRAVTTAINEWSITSHPLAAIRTLALVAAYVRATAVIAPLAHLVRSRLIAKLSHHLHAAERDDVSATIGILLAVISGFAPVAEANTAAEALYFDPHLPPRYAPILLNALCRAYPEEYPDYLPRALRIMRDHKSEFHVGLILDRVVSVITPMLFAKHLPRLENDVKPILTSLLNESPHSRIRIEASQGTYSVVTKFGEDALWECPLKDDHSAPLIDEMHAIYDSLIAAYEPENFLSHTLRDPGKRRRTEAEQ